MKKTIIESGFKYKYFYNNNGKLLLVKVYEVKFFGLINKSYGKYEFIYSDGKLVSQQNIINNIGVTESVNYLFDDDKLLKKEYFNDKGSLRYYMIITYKNNTPVRLEIFKNNNTTISFTEDSGIINNFLSKTGMEIDFLSEMLDFAESLKHK